MKTKIPSVAAVILFIIGFSALLPANEHPSLFIKKGDVAKIKERIDKYDWAKNIWEKLRTRADRAVEEKIELPTRGGNWQGYFACQSHNSYLTPGEKTGPWSWKYKCNSGGEELTGSTVRPDLDYDGCMINRAHQKNAGMVFDLGFAYAMTGEKKYLEKAREILLLYADAYPKYKLHDNGGKEAVGGARITSNTQDESGWMVNAAKGADLIWEGLQADDREKISRDLFIPAARDIIAPSKQGVHNIQVWKDTAMALIGFLTDRKELVDVALNEPDNGFYKQVKDGVLPDGMWWESAWGYHFYSLLGFMTLAEAARNNGMDLYLPELKRMLDVAVGSTMPDGRLPNFNDSGFQDLKNSAYIYELGYARFNDPEYAGLLAGGSRENIFALCFGAELSSASVPREAREAREKSGASGVAALSSGTGPDATWICVRGGVQGNAHSHFDKLGFILYSRGRVVSPDPGTCAYSLMNYDQWYKTSVAHNTLIVGERNQQRCDAKLVASGKSEGLSYSILDAGKIYNWAGFLRAVILVDKDTVIFVDRVDCDKPRTLDIAYHNYGTFSGLSPGEKWEPPGSNGYGLLENTEIRDMKEGEPVKISEGPERTTAVSLLLNEPTKLITGLGMAMGAKEKVPVMLFRRKAKNTVFIWGISLKGEGLLLKQGEINGDSASFVLNDKVNFRVTRNDIVIK
jgi:oligo-alginate lyase